MFWTILLSIAALVVALGILFWWLERQIDRAPFHGDALARKLCRPDASYTEWKAHYASAACQDPDARYFYTKILSENVRESETEKWVASEPDSAAAHLLHGARLVKLAWDARSSEVAAKVSVGAFDKFFELLADAREHLERAHELAPADAAVLVELMILARGQQWEPEEEAALYAQLQAVDRWNVPGARQRVQQLSSKWGGSHEAMMAFCRQISSEVPVGHPLAALVIDGHVEIWLRHHMDDDAEGAERYAQSVRSDAVSWYEKSFGSRHARETRCALFLRHTVAYWFWTVRDRSRMKKELDAIGPRLGDSFGYGNFRELLQARWFALFAR